MLVRLELTQESYIPPGFTKLAPFKIEILPRVGEYIVLNYEAFNLTETKLETVAGCFEVMMVTHDCSELKNQFVVLYLSHISEC